MTGKEATSGAGVALTDTQMKFLASMMRHAKTKPDIDWDKVAAEFNMTPKSAKKRHRIMSIKFGWNAKSDADGDSPGPKAPAKKPAGVTKRAGRVGDVVQKGKGKKIAAVQDDDDVVDDSVDVKPEMDMHGDA